MAEHKRLIDADELVGCLERMVKTAYPNLFPGLLEAIDFVKDFIAVDAAPVVRCKDCKFYTESENRCDHPYMDYDVECYDQWLVVNPDDFCSCSERRSDHETDKSG